MLNSIFLWFYCLDISDALLIVLTAAGFFLFLRHKFEARRFWKPGLAVLLLCWALVVTLQTVLGRTSGTHQEAALMPFQSYLDVWNGGNIEIYRSNLMNVLLFYPAGLLAISLWPKGQKAWYRVVLITLAFALFSIGIEYIQYRFGLGITQTDDVIHNTLGAFLGVMTGIFYEKCLVEK